MTIELPCRKAFLDCGPQRHDYSLLSPLNADADLMALQWGLTAHQPS